MNPPAIHAAATSQPDLCPPLRRMTQSAQPGGDPPSARRQTSARPIVVTQVINLCGEPVVLYDEHEPGPPGPDAVARIVPADRLKPAARLREMPLGPERVVVAAGTAATVRDVQFGPVVEDLPAPQVGVVYLVSLAVALAARRRHDLLVPCDPIRDATGAVLGYRALARPL